MKRLELTESPTQTRSQARVTAVFALLLMLVASGCGATKSSEVERTANLSGGDTIATQGTNAVPSPSPASATSSSKAIAWELGNKLSLAALLYNAQGTENSESLTKAKILAGAFGAQVPPFPTKTGGKAKDSAAITAYLLNDAGKTIIEKVEERYDKDHADLFEMSLKSNLLLMMYGPGEKTGKTIADVIERNGMRAKLPESLWQPVVSKVETDASFDDVKEAIFKMQADVRRHLDRA